jgi:uncharacterized delta-60 repeat protein
MPLLAVLAFVLNVHAQTAVQTWAARYSNVADAADVPSKAVTDAAGSLIVAGSSDDGLSGGNLVLIKYSNAGVALWTNRFEGPGSSPQLPAVAVDTAGNIFVVIASLGSAGVADLVTLGYSSAGVPLWTNRYNGLGNAGAMAGGLALDGSGNVVVTGSTVGNGTFMDYSTIKYSGAGVPLWTNRYNGPGNGDDYANAIAVDTSSGNVFVTGASDSGTAYDFTTVAYSSAGTPLWVNRYHGAGNGDEAYAVAAAVGQVFVTGFTTVANGYADYLTLGYSSGGIPLWTNLYNGPGNEDDKAAAIAVFGTNVFVTGTSYGGGASFDDIATLAYSSAGAPLWTNRYNGPGNTGDTAYGMAVDAGGNLYVAGSSYGNTSGYDYATIAYSSAGMVLWVTHYNGPGNANDLAQAVATDASGNVFVTGYSDSGTSLDWATIKYSSVGLASWTNRYNGLASSDGAPQAVAVDNGGNVIVTGNSLGTGTGKDLATLKYSSAGLPLWTNRYAGPTNSDDYANAVAVDATGNVFVAGSTPGANDYFDYLTLAYSSAGAPLWTNLYNGPGNGSDGAQAVAVDGNGNVLVTGGASSSSGQNYVTLKYSNSGLPLWTNIYAGPTSYDLPAAMALDASGNVLVTGRSQPTNGLDYATIKISSVGVTLWTNRYHGPVAGEDYATALAVDAAGNVVVTGYSQGAGSGYDYLTLKYSCAGVPLWTNRYNGPGNDTDYAEAVAVDASGNAFVTGVVRSGGLYEYATLAYSAAGVPLWTNLFHSVGNDDEALAVVVDASGRVWVTGASSSGTAYDFATVVYSNAGLPLGTNRYNGPANGDDSPQTARSLAVVGNGSVVVVGQSAGAYGGGRNDFATVEYALVPRLAIRSPAANTVALSWPSPSAGFHLQSNTNLASPNWLPVGVAPADDGTNKTLIVSPAVGEQFYRLSLP